jgi:hypothetical protein
VPVLPSTALPAALLGSSVDDTVTGLLRARLVSA